MDVLKILWRKTAQFPSIWRKEKQPLKSCWAQGSLRLNLLRIDQVIAGNGNNVLIGNDHDNLLEGNAGADTLDGGAVDDILVGGYGADRFILGKGRVVIQDFDPIHGDRLVGSGSFSDTTYKGSDAVVVSGDGGSTIVACYPGAAASHFDDLAAQGMIWA